MLPYFWLVLCFQCFVSFAEVLESYNLKSNTVEYVTVVFRHGDRTVDAGTVYPNDPYINETYYPYGIGQLTAKGKEREYAIGKLLRKRYDSLLGPVYTPDIIDAVSTNMNRTKASLSLVLAGLYPPIGNIMEWNSHLNWQPIPYNYLDFEKDLWFSIAIYFCPNYAKEYAAYLEQPEGKKLQDKYASLFEYVSDNTGLHIKRLMEVFFVHSCLTSQSEWGLRLPEWTTKVFPEPLTEATKEGLASGVATKKLKQLSGGLLIKKINELMKSKAENTVELEGRKMALYSGHDLSIVYLLGALNVFVPHVVPYGACVLIELHKISEQYYVKVLYEDYAAAEPSTLTIPGCDQLCPLDKFIELVKENYPDKENPCGDDNDDKVFHEHNYQRDYYRGKVHYKSVTKRYKEWARDAHQKIRKGTFNHTSDFYDKVGKIASLLENKKGYKVNL